MRGRETRGLTPRSRKHVTKLPFAGLKSPQKHIHLGLSPHLSQDKKKQGAKCGSNLTFHVSHVACAHLRWRHTCHPPKIHTTNKWNTIVFFCEAAARNSRLNMVAARRHKGHGSDQMSISSVPAAVTIDPEDLLPRSSVSNHLGLGGGGKTSQDQRPQAVRSQGPEEPLDKPVGLWVKCHRSRLRCLRKKLPRTWASA